METKHTVTQKQVDTSITYLITEAEKFEDIRDACVFESTAYWAAHDAFINVLSGAESLMPGQHGSVGSGRF